MFEVEATDRAARAAYFARNPELRVHEPPAEFSRAARVAPQAWGEHCVECAIPHCYTSCDLYRARPDGKCRRFTFGIFPNRNVRTWLPYGAEIDFRLISHLWTKGSAATLPLWQYRALDLANRFLARAVDTFSRALGPLSSRRRPNRGFYFARKEFLRWLQGRGRSLADGFLLQVVNPHERVLEMRFEASADPRPPNAPIFQTRFRLPPGFSEHWVPTGRIREQVDVSRPFEMSLLLGNSDPTLLYVLAASFVSGISGPVTQKLGEGARDVQRDLEPVPNAEDRKVLPTLRAPVRATAANTEGAANSASAPDRPLVKCVIWDLDHTIWDGVLIESGGDPPELLPRIRETVRELDDRGILQSVVSKNNHESAWARLEALGLSDYFLFPEISWGPKSEGVKRIVENLNIGADTVVLIDDQPFERAEVARSIPEVEVLPETAVEELLTLPRFQLSPSPEGKRRRERYRDQAQRAAALEAHGSDYIAFLRSARIRLQIRPPRRDELDRVHELIQRTNQMNFSGNRYSRDAVEARLKQPDLDAFVLRVTDRFGDYGLVGFAFIHVDETRARLVDLAMSCRIQSKHIEHQFLLTLLDIYRSRALRRFEVEFRRTERNSPVAQVFFDLDFTREPDLPDEREVYAFDLARHSRTRDYIEVTRGAAEEVAG